MSYTPLLMSFEFFPVNNPFAILNLSADSSVLKINNKIQKNIIKSKLKGDSSSSEVHFLERASENLIDPVKRFRYGFFWLTLAEDEESSFSANSTLANLGVNWCETAEKEYESIASSTSLVIRNHNKAILQLGTALASSDDSLSNQEQLWLSAFRSWVLVLDSNAFWEIMYERANVIDDPRLNSNELSKWRSSMPEKLLEYCRVESTSALKDHKDSIAIHWVNIIRKSPFSDIAIDNALGTIYEPFTKSIELKLDQLEQRIEGKPTKTHLSKVFKEFKADVLPSILQLVKLGDLPGLAEEHARDRSARFLRSISVRLHNLDSNSLSYEANQIALKIADSDSLIEKLSSEKSLLKDAKILGNALSLIKRGKYDEAVDDIEKKLRSSSNATERMELEKAKKEVGRMCSISLFNKGMDLLNTAIRNSNAFGGTKPSEATLDKALSYLEKAQTYHTDADIRKMISQVKEIKSKLYGSSCFIATATFGSAENSTVVQLRNFRDLVLAEYVIGRACIKIYWVIGPILASAVRFMPSSRLFLKPLLRSVANFLINTVEYKKRSL
jgi:hypothetical protein